MMKVTKLPTEELHGYNVQFSSSCPSDHLACAASVNYGLAGSGVLIIYQNSNYGYVPARKYTWKDGVFDVSWNRSGDLIATGSGDGKLQVWDLKQQNEPHAVLSGHFREASSVNWNLFGHDDLLVSTSWDETVRVWNVCTGVQQCGFVGHTSIVYEASWSPHMPGILASVGADKNICLWDIREPGLLPQEIEGHSSDVLSIDWSILDQHVIATGGVDHVIKGFDLRYSDAPIFQIIGHEAAVRRVRFSPFHRNVLASTSYDFSTRFWDWMTAENMHMCLQHTEFVYGLDFSSHTPDKVADCSWDGFIHIYEDVDFNCDW